MNAITVLGLILGSSVLTALINRWRFNSERVKIKAETESIVITTYNSLIGSLRSELDRLHEQVERQHKREEAYLIQNSSLLADKNDQLARIQRLEKERDELRDLVSKLQQTLDKLNSK